MPTHAGPYRLFLAEPTGLRREVARRYTSFDSGRRCPISGHGHDAAADVCDVPEGEDRLAGRRPDAGERLALPFPEACACGYRFEDDDPWQIAYRSLYAARVPVEDTDQHPAPLASDGDVFTLDTLPIGACYHATWWSPEYLVVVCPWAPDGSGRAEWHVDGPANNGSDDRPGWTRTGTVPRVTARPSIFIDAPHGWHGWLRDGLLVPV